LTTISQQLQQLVGAAPKVPVARPSSLRNAKPKMRPAGTTVEIEGDFPDLDPGVVAAAKQAGIARSTLIDMQKMVASNKKGAEVFRQTTPAVNTSVLSESEDDRECRMRWVSKWLIWPTCRRCTGKVDNYRRAFESSSGDGILCWDVASRTILPKKSSTR